MPDAIGSRIKVIAISAGKGGVGKSCVSVNLAIALAQLNRRVLLFDADLGLANIDIMLGLSSGYNLAHVISGSIPLADIILTGPSGIRIIPSASGTDYMSGLSIKEHAGIINAFNGLQEPFDYLIIDTAAGISETVLSFLRSAQEIIVVICDEPTSLTDSYALMKVMYKRFGCSHFHVLANKISSIKEGKELFYRLYRAAEEFLDLQLDYLGAIPFDRHVHKAVKKQAAVLTLYPYSKAAKSIRMIAQEVETWPLKEGIGGNTGFFLEQYIQNQSNSTLSLGSDHL